MNKELASQGEGISPFPKDESVAIDMKGQDSEEIKNGVNPKMNLNVSTSININGNTGKNPGPNELGLSVACTSNENFAEHVGIKIYEDHNDPLHDAKLTKPDSTSKAHVKVSKPLCADYKSEVDSEADSNSDSNSASDSGSQTETLDSGSDSSSSEEAIAVSDKVKTRKKKKKKASSDGDLSLSDLPPIENLRISVPEEECEEIGIVSGIVGTLVVVEAYKNTPAYDIDTVLFLDKGRKALGKIFDVFGPVSEPVYSVRFNNTSEIQESDIKKGLKVYCAPKTEHTSLVFVSDLMKMKGSDASWKNNEEPPQEFQDFSDDEAEERFRKKESETVKKEQPPAHEEKNPKKPRFHRPKYNYNHNHNLNHKHIQNHNKNKTQNQNQNQNHNHNHNQNQILIHNQVQNQNHVQNHIQNQIQGQNQNMVRFRAGMTRYPPPNLQNNWTHFAYYPRFVPVPQHNPIQLSYQYPPQVYFGHRYYPQGFQRPGYFPNFPPAFPHPQFVYPPANPFLLPPPGPPPPITQETNLAGEPPNSNR